LNALQLIRMQIIVAISGGAMNIVLSIWLINLVGMEGAVYGSIITYFVCGFVPYSVFFYRFFYSQQG
jgi:multisubunit Na+/H+ antiporter MnhF subunit